MMGWPSHAVVTRVRGFGASDEQEIWPAAVHENDNSPKWRPVGRTFWPHLLPTFQEILSSQNIHCTGMSGTKMLPHLKKNLH